MQALFGDYDAIRKSGLFDPEYYLATYPDVARRNLDPLVHYLEEGARQGRNPNPDFDAAFYLEQCRAAGEEPANPLTHYLRAGAARGLRTRRDGVAAAPAPGESAPPLPAGASQNPFLVALEMLGVLGASNGASRVTIGGWALATGPIAEIAVTMNGKVVATAHRGLARPDVARQFPDRAGAEHPGFILAFDLPGEADGTTKTMLTVRTETGETGRRPLPIEVPPQQPDIPVVDPLQRVGQAEPVPPPIRLAIDAARIDRTGMLRVEGWVVCAVQLESVAVFIGDTRLGAAEFGRTRPDIKKRHPEYPNSLFSGFLFAADIGRHGAGGKTLTVRATARGNIAGEATARVEVPLRAAGARRVRDTGFVFHWDEAALAGDGRIAVRGWAVGAAPIEQVLVLFDDREVGRARVGLERPEVGNIFPALAHAREPGFALETRVAGPIAAEHKLTVRVHLANGRAHEEGMLLAASKVRRWGTSEIVGNADLQLQVDSPYLIDGTVPTPVRGSLGVSGWALARAGVAAIEIAIDGVPTALADHGLRRLDIRDAFPDRSDALSSGFNALLPHRVLPSGAHAVQVTLRDNAGRSVATEFRIDVEEPSDTAGPWSLRRRVAPAEADLVRRILDRRGWHPLFAVVLTVAEDAAEGHLQARETIASLCAQAYPNWVLLLPGKHVRDAGALVAEVAAAGGRIEVVRDITAAAVAEIGLRLGAAPAEIFVTALTPGDRLGCDAFLEMAMSSALHPGADFLYSDERAINPASGAVDAYFKPQWSPDLLLSTNYVGRLWCARADLLAAAVPARGRLLRHGEYDLVLCCTERAAEIRHVPAVLCERAPGSRADPAGEAAALARALTRRGIIGSVARGLAPGTHRIRRRLAKPGLVSIIIPTCAARGLIETCIGTLRRLTAYRDFEIVCIENIPPEDRKWRTWLRRHADRVISTTEAYNWARFSNLAAAEAKGEYLLFLNDDIEIIEPDWLDTLLAHAQRPEVGVIGPRLLYPDRRVQHAGMFLAAMGQARHAFRYAGPDDPGYFGLALTERNVIAVTGACLLTRRETFDALDGFDETQAIVNNDLDFCLRAWQRGLANLYTPHATLIHHEAVSRAALDDEYDAAAFDGKWRDLFLAGDPFYSPHLSKFHDELVAEHEPTELVVTGGPSLRREEIRSILAVKLDHIGDCVLAFPALRRLRHHFPEARITVLTATASLAIWKLEPSVDDTIAFDFFHTRSALGERELSEADWRDLRQLLSRERFDLAVDLRKHTETRPVLQHSGARYLAGFDFRNQFPWLDISLEWTGDQIYARKRQHNADDLVNLIDAIAAATGESERAMFASLPEPSPEVVSLLDGGPAEGPLVCVHPTVGNDTRQWPTGYFAVLIDRLVEADGARVFVIGGPGDERIADALIGQLRHPDAVTSLVGKVPLSELPALLAGMSLFIGNNSGPKHIAAGLGVPTVGIHDGTVDVREWGPVGPAAIAVTRSVACSPCYLARVEDCRRGLVCLTQLEPARVYAACKRLLLLSAPPRPPTATAAARELRPAAGKSRRPPRQSAGRDQGARAADP